MAFVALLAGGIVISISTALKVWNRVAEANELNQEARAVMEIISRDLRNAYVGFNRNGGFFVGAPAEDVGSSTDELFFTTQSTSASDLGLLPEEMLAAWDQSEEVPVSDYVGVLWRWEGEEGLCRTTFVMPGLETEEQSESEAEQADDTGLNVSGEIGSEFVSNAIEELRFAYYDGESWQTSWDSRDNDNYPPQAVAIEFVLRDPSERENERGRRVSNEARHTFRSIVTLPQR